MQKSNTRTNRIEVDSNLYICIFTSAIFKDVECTHVSENDL